MKKGTVALIILLIIFSNLVTAWVAIEIILRTIAEDLAFSTKTVVVDDDRFIIIDTAYRGVSSYTAYRGVSSYYRRTPFCIRFVEDIDIVPTAESAVRIADIISSSMTCERYGDFDPFKHDAGVRFYEEDNVWEVFYHVSRISRDRALFAARGGGFGGLGRLTAGPSFYINKTTGEITILHEGFTVP